MLAPLKVTDSATLMKVYRLLENYFLQVVNYQFQAVTCYMNAANMVDTIGPPNYNANLYYTGSFRGFMDQEEFLGGREFRISHFTIQISHFLPPIFIFIFDFIALNNLTSCSTSE